MTTQDTLLNLITNINADFPYAKQDNSSQGFRDNFHYIKYALTNIHDTPFQLPAASDNLLGGVKIGSGLTINSYTGVLSVNQPIASSNTLGFIKIGNGLRTDQITGITTLAPATTSTIGGVTSDGYSIIIDNNGIISLTGKFNTDISSGTITSTGNAMFAGSGTFGGNILTPGNISCKNGNFTGNIYASSISLSGGLSSKLISGTSTGYIVNFNTLTNQLVYVPTTSNILQPATTSTLGGVIIGAGISVDSSGIISVNTGTPYTLQVATDSKLGGVKIGSGLLINSTGLLSVVNTGFNGGTINQPLLINNYTQASSTLSGALVVQGGVGIAKTLWAGEARVERNGFVGGQLFVQSTTTSTSTTTGALIISGGAGIGQNLYVGNRAIVWGDIISLNGDVVLAGLLKTIPTTISALPSAIAAGAGARAYVTDAESTAFLATVSGGGTNSVPVVSNGINWVVG